MRRPDCDGRPERGSQKYSKCAGIAEIAGNLPLDAFSLDSPKRHRLACADVFNQCSTCTPSGLRHFDLQARQMNEF